MNDNVRECFACVVFPDVSPINLADLYEICHLEFIRVVLRNNCSICIQNQTGYGLADLARSLTNPVCSRGLYPQLVRPKGTLVS